MLNWKIWSTFAAIFLAGAIVGVTGTGLYIKLHFAPPKDREAFLAEMVRRVTDGIQSGLDLSDQDTEPIREEVASSLRQLQKIRAGMQPQAEAVLADGIRRVKSHLSPEQQEEFDRMIEEARKREFSIFRLPPPPPPFP